MAGQTRECTSGKCIKLFLSGDVMTGRLVELKMVPFQIRRFTLHHPSEHDQLWMLQTMNQECAVFGANVTRGEDGHLELSWG